MPSDDLPPDRIRRLRDAIGWSQRELAAELGVAPSAVAQWETGVHAVPGPVVRLIEVLERELGLGPEPDADDRLELGRWGRAKTSAAMAVTFFWERFLDDAGDSALTRRARRAAIDRLARTASKARGPLLKWIQLATTLRYQLPNEQRAILEVIDGASRPMRPSRLVDVFMKELGRPPSEVFAWFDPEPTAVTSLGQVHACRTHDGREAVVKVQHPGIRRVFEADLENFEMLLRSLAVITPAFESEVFFSEFRERVLDECDYRAEAEHLRLFARAFGGSTSLRIPEVIESHSGETVITLSRVDGMPWERFVAEATPEARTRAATALWTFSAESLLVHGMLHADAHPRNYLVDADGTVAVVDFGRVSRWREAFQHDVRALLRAVLERDRAAIEPIWLRMGMVRAPERFDFDALFRQLVVAHQPWLGAGPFRFDARYAEGAWNAFAQSGPNRRAVTFTPETVFAPQVCLLAFQLAQLDAEITCRDRMLELLYEPGEQRPEPFGAAELRSWTGG